MDCVTLLAEARESGLKVSANSDQLVIRGPKSVGHIAEALIVRKQEIMDLLSRRESKPASNLDPRHPLTDFDSSVFGSTPKWVQHKRRDCQSTQYW